MDDDYVDAETDLDGRIRAAISEQMAAAEFRWQRWMEGQLEKVLKGIKTEYWKETNKVYDMMNKNLNAINQRDQDHEEWIANDADWKEDFTDVLNEVQDRYEKYVVADKKSIRS